MTRKISTFVLLGLVATVIVWMLDKESVATINWREFDIALSVPELLLLLLFAVVVLDVANRLFRALLKLQVNEVYKTSLLSNRDGQEDETIDVLAGKISEKIIIDRKDFDRSLLQVLKAMTAITAGDMAEARQNIKELKKVIGKDPIIDLLMMKIYKGEKNYDKMEKLSEKLMRNADIQIVGMKAAVEAQMEKKEFQVALATVNKAFELRQDLYWIIESAFELRAKAQDWEGAIQVLDAGYKKKIIPLNKYNRLRAMVLFERAKQYQENGDEVNFFKYVSQAIKADDTLVPAALALADYYKKNDNQVRLAENVLMTAWKKNPTDAIAYAYIDLYSDKKGKERMKRLETLVNCNALRPSLNNRLVAELAIEGGHWAKAKSEVEMFLVNNPCTKKVCNMIAEIEDKFNKDKKEAKAWRKRLDSCADDALWVCAVCGEKSEEWHSVCPNCKAFGQDEWHLYVEHQSNDVLEEIDDDEDEE